MSKTIQELKQEANRLGEEYAKAISDINAEINAIDPVTTLHKQQALTALYSTSDSEFKLGVLVGMIEQRLSSYNLGAVPYVPSLLRNTIDELAKVYGIYTEWSETEYTTLETVEFFELQD